MQLDFGNKGVPHFLYAKCSENITPRLATENGMVNAYLLETDDSLVLVDAGWPNKTEVIFKAVQKSGHNPADIRHLVLTHGHIDHAGSAAEVWRRTGARTYAHAADLELINNGRAERPGTSVTPGIIPAFAYRFFIKPGGTTYESFAVDQTLKDGETLPMANDVEVIHSPGHCAGHTGAVATANAASQGKIYTFRIVE